MANQRVPATPLLASPARDDIAYNIDVSDTTDHASGTSTHTTWGGVVGVFNVLHYGATGDGSTNDSAAITLALAAITANSGGTLYFPAGTYRTDKAILGVSDCVIHGDGVSSVIKPLSTWAPAQHPDGAIGANNAVIGLFAGGSLGTYTNCTIRDLWIDGQDYVSATPQNGVMFSYAQGCHVERVKVSGIDNYGIWVRHGSDYTVRDCHVHGGTECIEASQTVDDVKILGNYVSGIDQETGVMILIYGDATNVIISDNTGNGYGTGIGITASSGGCRWVTLSNNNMNVKDWTTGAVKYGIDMDDNDFATSANITVLGGRYESEQSSIIVRNTNASMRDISIVGCTLIATADTTNGYAILFSSGTYGRVTVSGTVSESQLGMDFEALDDGSLTGNAVGTILVNGRFGSNIMTNVSMTGNTVAAGRIEIGSNCVASGNLFLAETASDFVVTGTNNLISSNRIKGGQNIDVNGNDNYIHGNMFDTGGAVSTAGTTGNVTTANETI